MLLEILALIVILCAIGFIYWACVVIGPIRRDEFYEPTTNYDCGYVDVMPDSGHKPSDHKPDPSKWHAVCHYPICRHVCRGNEQADIIFKCDGPEARALNRLVALKIHKDSYGKDEHYLKYKQAAWDQAFDAVSFAVSENTTKGPAVDGPAIKPLAEDPGRNPPIPGSFRYRMHVAGPDDVIDFDSEREALRSANDINIQGLEFNKNKWDDGSFVLMFATVESYVVSESDR